MPPSPRSARRIGLQAPPVRGCGTRPTMDRLQAMGVSRLGQRTDDIVWDEGHENDFFRRMPSALSLALEATDLESLARATAKGAEVLWGCSAEVVLPSEGELRRKIQATTLNGSRRRQG